jgi:hypothetical protein
MQAKYFVRTLKENGIDARVTKSNSERFDLYGFSHGYQLWSPMFGLLPEQHSVASVRALVESDQKWSDEAHERFLAENK